MDLTLSSVFMIFLTRAIGSSLFRKSASSLICGRVCRRAPPSSTPSLSAGAAGWLAQRARPAATYFDQLVLPERRDRVLLRLRRCRRLRRRCRHRRGCCCRIRRRLRERSRRCPLHLCLGRRRAAFARVPRSRLRR